MIRDGDFTTGNLLNYEYFCKHFKLIAIDLSKQEKDPKNQNEPKPKNQQINFIGKLQQDATIIFIIEEKHKTKLEFSQNSLSIV